MRVVILDGDDAAVRRAAGGDEAGPIDRLNRVGVDDANRDALALQLLVRLAALRTR